MLKLIYENKDMNKNYFQGTTTHPYHISIGGVVRNEEGKICCHYFDSITHESVGTLTNFVLLMRETIEENETIEECLARGLMEEFGIVANLNRYIGSITCKFKVSESPVEIEKTTLYFLCDFVSIDEQQRKEDDIEAKSIIKWFTPDELILRMQEQGKRLHRDDTDESSIIKNLILHI